MLNIIVLTYNNLNATRKCLENLYKYTKDFNLIVIDNNSTDETIPYLTKLRSDKGFSFIKNKENNGIILGRNQGYSFSQKEYPHAEYICFLDNDQYVQEGWQESHLELFERGYDLIGCEAWRMRKEDFYPYKRIVNKNEEFNYVGCGGMMIRTYILNKLKGFDERYEKYYFEDPHLCWVAHKIGYKIGWNHKNVVEHQKHNLFLSGERKIAFHNNWKKFRDEWAGVKMPSFCMKED